MTAQYLQQAIALEPQARTWAHTDADFALVRTAPEVAVRTVTHYAALFLLFISFW